MFVMEKGRTLTLWLCVAGVQPHLNFHIFDGKGILEGWRARAVFQIREGSRVKNPTKLKHGQTK